MHREVLRIFAGASGVTRPYYERGRYMDGGNEDNWVIRWMLWNIFRYGMNRRRNNDPEDLVNSPEGSPSLATSSPTASPGGSSNSSRRTGKCLVDFRSQKARNTPLSLPRAEDCLVPYDPIRDS